MPILETALITYKLRPVFLSHEGDPISAAQRIHKAGFLCPPACAFILRDRWSCCWSLHHWMREMMLVGSYFMVPSCARCDGVATRVNGIRDRGNALSGKSQHLRRGKPARKGGTDLNVHSGIPAWLTLFAALTRKGLNPRHWQVNRSVVQKQLFFTLETRSLPSGSARRLVLPRLLLDRSSLVVGVPLRIALGWRLHPQGVMPYLNLDKSHTPEGLTGNSDETCPALGMFTLGTMRKLGGSPAGEI